MKVCSKCRLAKPLGDFWKDSTRHDGRQYVCVACKRATVKACRKCAQRKRLREFHRDKTQADGYHPVCKPCRRGIGPVAKRCSKCRAWKELAEFHTDRSRRLGVTNACKVCRAKEYEALEEPPDRREYYAENAERLAGYQRHKKFGLTAAQYDAMLAQQNGCCAICRRSAAALGRSLAVDHDHDTGKVRGLLCGTCNTALGGFRDNPTLLWAALGYLRKHI